MTLADSLKRLSHHSYCIIGPDPLRHDIRGILEDQHSIIAQANPDFFEQSYQTFTIDEARNLKSLHETRPIGTTGKRIFIISMNGVTIEAQNALLKLLEEPAEYAHFFLIIPSAHLLLPTVKSRLHFIGEPSDAIARNPEAAEEARKFLRMTSVKKLDYVKKLVDDISKEKLTRQDAIDFLDAVEGEIHAKRNLKEHMKTLEAISLVRKYIYDRAPSVKMLLEYMALS
jgi:DNA polymerase III delta prime subunit